MPCPIPVAPPVYGCIAGMMWLKSPMSVEPPRTLLAGRTATSPSPTSRTPLVSNSSISGPLLIIGR